MGFAGAAVPPAWGPWRCRDRAYGGRRGSVARSAAGEHRVGDRARNGGDEQHHDRQHPPVEQVRLQRLEDLVHGVTLMTAGVVALEDVEAEPVEPGRIGVAPPVSP